MILEQETHDAFGYYPSALKPKSNKRILAICVDCGKVRAIHKSQYCALCKSCSLKGKSYRNKGRTLTAEHKRKIGEGNKGKTVSDEAKRKMGESLKGRTSWNKGMKGEAAPNWRGGISFEPYCIKFNKAYKTHIRNLFGNKCFLCGISEAENSKKLDVHHVNYNKDCGCDDTVCICVPLCRSCHMRTNGNRDYWEELIMRKLKNTLLGW